MTAPIDIGSVLREAVTGGGIPGVVAAAATADGPLYEGAFGSGDVANAVPMAPDSIFRIASMTKAVTSVAVMQLVERDQIDLDRAASDYLDEFGLTWAGLFNSYFWIDRSSGVAGVLMTQILPFGDREVLELVERFERAVYSNS